MDHQYSKADTLIKKNQQRCSSFMCFEHSYTKLKVTPIREKHGKRKRDTLTPSGTTPRRPVKMLDLSDGKRQISWSSLETEFLKQFVKKNPRVNLSVNSYWQECAAAMNLQFPEHRRSWHSCKSMSQRLYLSPSTSSTMSTNILESGCSYLPSFTDAGTQTTFTFTVNTAGVNRKEGEWAFMEPKKELKENAGIGAKTLNREALKRLRCFPEDMKSTERAHLINLLYHGSCQEVARAILSSSLYEKIKTLILYDIEMDARECSNEGSVLYKSRYEDLKTFKWRHIVNELVSRQSFLAEVLLAVSLPTGKIGNTKATEELVPVLGTVYGILMKQRFHKLAAVQKVVAVTLANEQTHQKVLKKEFALCLKFISS